jgi:N6-adenosine-specific RNA methylase IME4
MPKPATEKVNSLSQATAEVHGASLAPNDDLYENAYRAVAACKTIDEAKEILDRAVAWTTYARRAKNREMEADAVAIRLRATRMLDKLRRAQAETVGLNRGSAGAGRPSLGGLAENPPKDERPTLASQGVDKNLAQQARVLGALSDQDFEAVVTDARDKVSRAVRNAVREVEIQQERAIYRARVEEGCTVDDLHALAASGFKAGVIGPDFPWKFLAYSNKGKQRSAERRYDTLPLDRIMAMAPLVKQLAAPDCALVLWAVWPDHPGALEFIEAADFEYKTVAFVWVKTTKNAECIALDGNGLHWGEGLTGTRSNTEVALLATRGSPRRLSLNVHQVVIAPAPDVHSEKPDEVYRRIERLFPGPYLELFARKPRPHWTCWGDEIPRDQFREAPAEPAESDPPPVEPPQPREAESAEREPEPPAEPREAAP